MKLVITLICLVSYVMASTKPIQVPKEIQNTTLINSKVHKKIETESSDLGMTRKKRQDIFITSGQIDEKGISNLVYHYMHPFAPLGTNKDENCSVRVYSNKKSYLKTGLVALSDIPEFKEIKREIVNSTVLDNFHGAHLDLENHSDSEQDLSSMINFSKSFTSSKSFTISAGFTTGFTVSAKLFGTGGDWSSKINLGAEYNQQWTDEVTFSVTPTTIKVPPKSKITVNYSVRKTEVRIKGIAKVNLDPDQRIWASCTRKVRDNLFSTQSYTRTLKEIIDTATKVIALDKLTSYITVENDKIYANVPYESKFENYGHLTLKVGAATRI